MITLGRLSFAGPFMAPLWSAPKSAGVFAVMAPGWRPLTFRALEFAQAGNLAEPQLLKQHPKYAEWLRIVGTEWNLYVATHELSFSTEAQRAAVLRELARDYKPEFKALSSADVPSLKAMLLARSLRQSETDQ